jgi:hypothetical protein
VPFEYRRGQPDVSDEGADRVVLDDLAKLIAPAVGDGEQQRPADVAALPRTAPHLSAKVSGFMALPR